MYKSKRKDKAQGPLKHIPGHLLFKHIQYGNTPKFSGMYLVYYKPKETDVWSNTFPPASIRLLEYDAQENGGSWLRNLHILAFLGPLPYLTLDEIQNDCETQEILTHAFAVGTLEEGMQFNFIGGPWSNSIRINTFPGEEGLFGFDINPRTTQPTPIFRFSIKTGRWVPIKNPKKFIDKCDHPGTTKKSKKMYWVGTVSQIKKGKPEKIFDFGPDGVSYVPLCEYDDSLPNKVYLFEKFKQKMNPQYRWKNGQGWGAVSDKMVRKLNKILGTLGG